jgi:hypothetical protein
MRPWARKLVAEIDQRYQRLIDREMARPRRRWIGTAEIAELEIRERGLDDDQESRWDLLREIALAVEDGAFEAGDRMTVVWLPKALFIYGRLDRRLLQRLELRIQRNRFAALERTESHQDFLENVVGRLAVRVDAYLRWRCARGLTDPLPAPFGDAPSLAEMPTEAPAGDVVAANRPTAPSVIIDVEDHHNALKRPPQLKVNEFVRDYIASGHPPTAAKLIAAAAAAKPPLNASREQIRKAIHTIAAPKMGRPNKSPKKSPR